LRSASTVAEGDAIRPAKTEIQDTFQSRVFCISVFAGLTNGLPSAGRVEADAALVFKIVVDSQ
jgi:hypothetical protein